MEAGEGEGETNEELKHVQSSASTLFITEKMDEKLKGTVIHRERRIDELA